eukprot:scpid51219/ scgid3476/ Uncharacterized protein CXorf57
MAVADLTRRQVADETVRAVVLGLWRYQVTDNDYLRSTRENYVDKYCRASRLAYDVELHDVCGVSAHQRTQLRCAVSSTIYDDVRKGVLVPGHVIEISGWKLVYDDTQVSSSLLTVIQAVRHASGACTCGVREHNELPSLARVSAPSLIGQRALCYNAWTREDPVGPKRLVGEESRSSFTATARVEVTALLRGRLLINDLQLGREKKLICGRVMMKERLATYVPSKKPEKYPYILHILLADESGAVHVFFWHQMALACVSSVRESDVLVCRNFKVKIYHRDRDAVEVALDPCSDPTDHIHVLPETLCPTALLDRLPRLDDNFRTLSSLQRQRRQSVPLNEEFSVAALIVYVCPWQRYRDVSVPEEFFQTRLLAVRDESSDQLLLLRVYAFSDEKLFYGLRAGQLLVTTHLCVGRVGSDDAFQYDGPGRFDELMVVTTSCSSQLYTFEQSDTTDVTFTASVLQSRFCRHDKVLKSAHWLDGADSVRVMSPPVECKDLCFDRLIPLPVPLDISHQQLHDIIQLRNNFEIVSSEDLARVISALDYRESKVVIFHATLASISFSCTMQHQQQVHGAAQPTAAASAVATSAQASAADQLAEQTHSANNSTTAAEAASQAPGMHTALPHRRRRRFIAASSDDSEDNTARHRSVHGRPPPPAAAADNVHIDHSHAYGTRVTAHAESQGTRATAHAESQGTRATAHAESQGTRATAHAESGFSEMRDSEQMLSNERRNPLAVQP